MRNPVVLITGALTGIGRAAAVAFAKKGAGKIAWLLAGHASLAGLLVGPASIGLH